MLYRAQTMKLKKYLFILFAGLVGLSGTILAQNSAGSGAVTDLFKFCSEMKGFNLLGKFDVYNSNTGFPEKEFSMIHDLGFNFVRLPLDFRAYTQYGNWDKFTEAEVAKIDKAVEFGGKYGVHVCINLHRAPGYCVNSTTLPTNQQLDLWTDTIAQKAFVKHWIFFANRYKAVSAEILSFDLVNEPSNVTEAVYVQVMKKAIQAIHQISPDRIIFVDGLDYGNTIVPSLKDEPNLAQSIHCYEPFSLTHYKAEWVSGSNDFPLPTWPILWISNYLYGPWKADFKSPLVFQGNFPAGTEVIVNVHQVSMESTLSIKAGTKTVLSKHFLCTADPGTDFTKINKTEWGYQNFSDKDYSAVLTEAATRLTIENILGDWMILNSISIKQDGKVAVYTLSDGTWGTKQSSYLIDDTGVIKTADGNNVLPFESYRKNIALAKANNIPFMVQEFGVYNKTPHSVAIGFLSDLTKFFAENNIGWALWNFSGSFGILNSDRADCIYEPYQGYQLDRQLLDVLTKSASTGAVNLNKQTLKIYPSPVKDELFISGSDFKGKTMIQVSDVTGRMVNTFRNETFYSGTFRMDVSNLKSGMYMIRAANQGQVFTGKFLISR